MNTIQDLYCLTHAFLLDFSYGKPFCTIFFPLIMDSIVIDFVLSIRLARIGSSQPMMDSMVIDFVLSIKLARIGSRQ